MSGRSTRRGPRGGDSAGKRPEGSGWFDWFTWPRALALILLALICMVVLARLTYAYLGPHLEGRSLAYRAPLGVVVGALSALPMLLLMVRERRTLKRIVCFYVFVVTFYHIITPLPPRAAFDTGEEALWRAQAGWYIGFALLGYLLGIIGVIRVAFRRAEAAAPPPSSRARRGKPARSRKQRRRR